MGVGARVLLIMFLLSLSLLFLSPALAECSEQNYFSESCPSGAYKCNPIKQGYTYQCNPTQQKTCSLSVPSPSSKEYDCSYYKTIREKICGQRTTSCTKFGWHDGTCSRRVPYTYYYPCTKYRISWRCSYRTISICTPRIRMCSGYRCFRFFRWSYCTRVSYPCGMYMSCSSRTIRTCGPRLESYRTTCSGTSYRTEQYPCRKFGLYSSTCTKNDCWYESKPKLVSKTCTKFSWEQKCLKYGTKTVYDTCVGDKTGYQVTVRNCKTGATYLPFEYDRGDKNIQFSNTNWFPKLPSIPGSNVILAGLGAASLAGLAAYRGGLDYIKRSLPSIFKKTNNQKTSSGILNFLGKDNSTKNTYVVQQPTKQNITNTNQTVSRGGWWHALPFGWSTASALWSLGSTPAQWGEGAHVAAGRILPHLGLVVRLDPHAGNYALILQRYGSASRIHIPLGAAGKYLPTISKGLGAAAAIISWVPVGLNIKNKDYETIEGRWDMTYNIAVAGLITGSLFFPPLVFGAAGLIIGRLIYDNLIPEEWRKAAYEAYHNFSPTLAENPLWHLVPGAAVAAPFFDHMPDDWKKKWHDTVSPISPTIANNPAVMGTLLFPPLGGIVLPTIALWDNKDKIAGKIKDTVNTVVETVKPAVEPVVKAAVNVGNAVVQATSSAAKTVVNTVKKAASTTTKAVSSTVNYVSKTVSNTVRNVAKTTTNVAKKVSKSVSTTVKKAASTVSKVVSSAVKTVTNTISNVAKTVSNTVSSAASTVTNAAKSVLGFFGF